MHWAHVVASRCTAPLLCEQVAVLCPESPCSCAILTTISQQMGQNSFLTVQGEQGLCRARSCTSMLRHNCAETRVMAPVDRGQILRQAFSIKNERTPPKYNETVKHAFFQFDTGAVTVRIARCTIYYITHSFDLAWLRRTCRPASGYMRQYAKARQKHAPEQPNALIVSVCTRARVARRPSLRRSTSRAAVFQGE
jgi:hypothetical protein